MSLYTVVRSNKGTKNMMEIYIVAPLSVLSPNALLLDELNSCI